MLKVSSGIIFLIKNVLQWVHGKVSGWDALDPGSIPRLGIFSKP